MTYDLYGPDPAVYDTFLFHPFWSQPEALLFALCVVMLFLWAFARDEGRDE